MCSREEDGRVLTSTGVYDDSLKALNGQMNVYLVIGIQCPRVSHGAFAECLTEVLMQQALRKRGREGITA